MSKENQRGSSAVEFAIILPLLLTLLLGIIEFGYLFNQQISLTQAAREGAREYAIHHRAGFQSDHDGTEMRHPRWAGYGNRVASGKLPSRHHCNHYRIGSYSSLTGWFDFLSTTNCKAKGPCDAADESRISGGSSVQRTRRIEHHRRPHDGCIARICRHLH